MTRDATGWPRDTPRTGNRHWHIGAHEVTLAEQTITISDGVLHSVTLDRADFATLVGLVQQALDSEHRDQLTLW